MAAVIKVDGLGKCYNIRRLATENYSTMRDQMSAQLQGLLKRRQRQQATTEEFWALRNIDFEIARGEVLGIIGRNGAGKSTLLKILSRITEPTEGRVVIQGRVASMLEVGTGFHPELSGRENIYLNGAILGMRRAEISSRFDEIVAFAGVEKFLETPVKRYSSGMYMRLAFSVAAHLEPDILVVDEVLAVGDMEFQKKCLGKLQDVSRGQGRTVLFVSHNMSAIRALCDRALLLRKGQIVLDGSVGASIEALAADADTSGRALKFDQAKLTEPRITGVEVNAAEACSGHFQIQVDFASPWKLEPVIVGAVVHNRIGAPVFGCNSAQDGQLPIAASCGRATLRIPNISLHSDTYSVTIYLGNRERDFDVLQNAAYFDFVSPFPLLAGLNPDTIGSMRVAGRWKMDVGAP